MAKATKRWQATGDHHRDSIKTAMLITRLQEHTNGERDLKPSQIRAAEVLLNRVLPTLQAMQVTVERGRALERDDLKARARALGMDINKLFGIQDAVDAVVVEPKLEPAIPVLAEPLGTQSTDVVVATTAHEVIDTAVDNSGIDPEQSTTVCGTKTPHSHTSESTQKSGDS